MGKKRYSNFHRARKWYRKHLRLVFNPNGTDAKKAAHARTLFRRYENKCERDDKIVLGVNHRFHLILERHE